MIDWLVPICSFWLMSAIFLGGVYDAEGGSAIRQAMGLLMTFAAYMLLFAALRLVLGGLGGESSFLGAVFGVVVPAGIPAMLLGRISKVVFRLAGVRIARKVYSSDMH